MKLAYSLRFRLTILYLLIVLVPILIIMVAMPSYYQNSITRETRTLTEGTLTSVSRNIETYLNDLDRLTIAPYLNEEVMRALRLKASPRYGEADDYTKLVADRALNRTLPLFLQNTRKDILGTLLVTADGSVYVTSIGGPTSVPDYPYTEQEWYKKAVDADGKVAFISAHPQDYLATPIRKQVFSVARLVRDPDSRQPLAVIMADADTIVLDRIISDIDFGVSSIVCIFDNDGRLLYSSQPVDSGLQAQAWEEAARMESRGLEGTESRGLEGTESRLALHPEGSTGGLEGIEYDNESYVTISKPILPAPWKLVVLLSNSEIAAKARWLYAVGILFAIGGLVLTFLLFYVLSRWIIHPFREMIAVMQKVQGGDLQTRFVVTGNDEIAELGNALNNMIAQLSQLIDREYKAVLNQRNAEYRALQSQIHPHFLYNTLNGFIGLNRLGDTHGLERAILALSGMLRYIFDREDWVRLGDEFLFIQRYCDLQRIRFQERLESTVCCDDAVKDVRIPKLLLQPLVENAVIHGIEPLSRPCRLSVVASLQQGNHPDPCGLPAVSREGREAGQGKGLPYLSLVQISIQDNGQGFDTQLNSAKQSLGIANVRERLTLAFSDAHFSITSQIGSGTLVTIKVPVLVD
jgi:two-component system sensor histidine kinase YesM